MKVKIRLQIIGMLPVMMALFIAAVSGWALFSLEEMVNRMRVADDLVQDVSRLNIATYRFVRNPTAENSAMWEEFHLRIGNSLIKNKSLLEYKHERILFDEIRNIHADIGSKFEQLSQKNLHTQSKATMEQMEQLISGINSLSVQMMSAARTLAANFHTNVIGILEKTYFAGISLAALTAFIIALLSLLMGRTFSAAVEKLYLGMQSVRRGNLSTIVSLTGDEEFIYIGNAFNEMVNDLKNKQNKLEEEAQNLRVANMRLSESLAKLKRIQNDAIRHERLQSLRQIADGILHNLNDAIMPVMGMSDYLLRYFDELKDKKELEESLRIIKNSSENARKVIRNLSEVFNPEERQSGANVDINKIIEEVISLTEPLWKDIKRAEGTIITCTVDKGEIPVFMSGSLDLKEILTTLLVNSIEAMPKGGAIRIKTRKEGNNVSVEVEDSGIGMDKEVAEKCFEPFFSTKGKGHSGLGLAIALNRAKRWGGTIEYREAVPGPGSIFKLTIPMLPPVKEEMLLSFSREIKTLKILVVDDMPWVRSMLSKILSHKGHAVDVLELGSIALEKCMQNRYDLIILDRSMPDVSGDIVARTIKKDFPHVKIIMLTGFGDVMGYYGEKPEGVDVVLSKPVVEDELLNSIYKLFS